MRSGKIKYCTFNILLDSGTSKAIISGSLIPKAQRKKSITAV